VNLEVAYAASTQRPGGDLVGSGEQRGEAGVDGGGEGVDADAADVEASGTDVEEASGRAAVRDLVHLAAVYRQLYRRRVDKYRHLYSNTPVDML